MIALNIGQLILLILGCLMVGSVAGFIAAGFCWAAKQADYEAELGAARRALQMTSTQLVHRVYD